VRFSSQHADARPDEVPDCARNWLARLSTALPIIGQLKNYRSTWLLSDATAGLAIAAVALPTAVAYPAIAGLPAAVGLYASILPLVAYAIFGSSR